MVSIAKVLLTIATSLSIKWFCEATVNQVNQTPNYLNNPFAKYLSQRGKYESDTLHLPGFVFDEISAKQFYDTFSELQHLTLDECGINNELISLLTLPSSLKSIRLERLNLSSKKIQSILDKLSPSLETLELIDCLVSKFSHQEVQSDSTPPEESLDLSRFSHLKTISINNLRNNFDSYNLLLSLPMLPLESIKFSHVFLDGKEWAELLKNWTAIVEERKNLNQVTFFNSLKEFDLKIDYIDKNLMTQLIHLLFSFHHLENISLFVVRGLRNVSLPPLPPSIKQLSLIQYEVFMEDGKTSFWNPEKLSQLTHLSADSYFKKFPNLFSLKQLEYLKIRIWDYDDISSVTDQCCSRLKYLSIQSKYLIPLLAKFENNFPEIETLEIEWEDSDKLDSYFKTIISSKTLKCLKINNFGNKKSTLKIEGELKSSIEELKLKDIYGDFVSDLEAKRFPCLKKLDIVTSTNNLILENALKKLSLLPQLTSLTLKGHFFLLNEKLSFRFENLKFFCLYSSQEIVDLDLLLSCMPNLIEFQLKGKYLRELKLQNPIGIRYLELPYEFLKNNGDYINVIRNTPNLIQLTTEKYWSSPIQSISYASELAYYFKELKKHFNSKLQFKINPNCYPIKQLKIDSKLLKLIRIKSSKLPAYLKNIFPFDSSHTFFNQFFTSEIEKYFGDKSIDYEPVIRFFNLLSELKVDSEEDFSFLRNLLLKGEKEYFTELINFSLDNFYQIFTDYLINSIEIKLEPAHKKFIEEFLKANKNYGLLKIFSFLKSFFTSFSVTDDESKIINDEIFYLFTEPLLTSSFSSLFYRIKEGNVDLFSLLFNGIKGSEEKKKSLPLKLESIAEELRNLKPEQYEKLCTHFKDISMELRGESFVESLFTVLHAILIPQMNCAICLDSLFNEKCKFFKSKDGNCHLFHRDCLNEWLKEKGICPHCRKTAL